MIRNFIVLIVLFFSTISYSQDRLGGFSNSLKTSDTFIRGAVPIVNSQNGDISFFLFDSTRIYGYLFNDNFEKIDEIKSDNRRRKYKSLIGSSISNDNVYKLFMSNENHTKFGYIDFSYSKKESKFKELDLKIDNEKYLETFVYDNKFFLMTITKKSSILNLYSFNNEGDYKKEIIDFSKEIFLNQSRKKVLLYNMFLDSKLNLYFKHPTKIEENNPNPIEVTSARRKLYLRGEKLVFTFDNNKEYTQIISLNLKTRDYNLRQIEKPYIPKGTRKQANSYINGDDFYTMVSTNEKFIFRIHDYKSGGLKKEYSTTVNDIISFKNSPIIQEGGIYDSYREMEKTRKYLRKITAGNLGISVYSINGNRQIILGGQKEITTNSGMRFGRFGEYGIIFNGSLGNFPFSNNPTFFAYYSYVNTKSTYIECLFDENFNHLQGEFQKNVFDKIKNYKDLNEIGVGFEIDYGETVFKYKDFYIFGYYNDRTIRYKFRKFTDKN